jgi:dTDP-4-dehydrorhamnose reductase
MVPSGQSAPRKERSQRFAMEGRVMRGRKPAEPLGDDLLVVGIDTMAGSNLAAVLGNRFHVRGLHQTARYRLERCGTRPADLTDPHGLGRLVREERPHWLVYCGPLGLCSWDRPDEPVDAELETAVCRALADAADACNAQLTVLTSDAVFCGPRMFHSEKSPARSDTRRAEAVRQAEATLSDSDALVVRSHAYGWSPAGTPPGMAEQIWLELTQGESLPDLGDRHATPILASDLAEFLLLAYRRRLKGVCHITGAERTSAERFAAELAAAFNLGRGPQLPGKPRATQPECRHIDETSLNTRRARRELQRPMPVLREGLERFAAQYTSGFRAQLQACGRRADQQNHAA